MFSAQLKDFFVKDGDPGYIRELKLEIMTQLASEANISTVLRELKVKWHLLLSRFAPLNRLVSRAAIRPKR